MGHFERNFKEEGGRPPTNFVIRNLESRAITWCCLRDPMFSRFDTIPACVTHTDRHTHGHTMMAITRASLAPREKIFVLSHPLGDLGVTCTVRLWLAGKSVVDLLLVLIEFFSLALMAAALLSEIYRNRRFLKGWVTLSANLW